MKNLFICGTPLQSLIAVRIIEVNNFAPEDCILFFYSAVKNRKYEHYYRLLSERCAQSVFYFCDFNFPGYIAKAKKIFSGMDYSRVYLASVNSVFVLVALSLKKHHSLYTFDDGTANLSPSSSYAETYGLSIKKYLALKLFGNTYSIQKIRQESLGHYTLYPGFTNNISSKLIPISIFLSKQHKEGSGRCAVILGTVFHEAFAVESIGRVITRLERLSESLTDVCFYIPHPRGETLHASGLQILDSEKIAEEIISDLLLEYAVVDLYGFCSSVQINMAHLPGVNNIFLTISGAKPHVWDMFELATRAGISPKAVIDLDAPYQIDEGMSTQTVK